MISTHPEVGDGQSVPEARVDHVDQVLLVGGDEGAVVGGEAHGLGLLVAQPVGRVQPRHVSRVRLIKGHQVELKEARRRRRRRRVRHVNVMKKNSTLDNVVNMTHPVRGGAHSFDCAA